MTDSSNPRSRNRGHIRAANEPRAIQVDLTKRLLTNLDSVVREHTETGSRRSGRSIETSDL